MAKERAIGFLTDNPVLIEKINCKSSKMKIIALYQSNEIEWDAMSMFKKMILLIRHGCWEIYIDCGNKIISNPSVWGAIYLVADIVDKIVLFNAREVVKIVSDSQSSSFYPIFYPAYKVRLIPDEYDEVLNIIKAE